MIESKFVVLSGLGSGKTFANLCTIEEMLTHFSWLREDAQGLKERLNRAVQSKDYLMVKSCLIELREILSKFFGPIRFSLILLCLIKLMGNSVLSTYKANLEIPPTSRQGERVDSFPPHICIYA